MRKRNKQNSPSVNRICAIIRGRNVIIHMASADEGEKRRRGKKERKKERKKKKIRLRERNRQRKSVLRITPPSIFERGKGTKRSSGYIQSNLVVRGSATAPCLLPQLSSIIIWEVKSASTVTSPLPPPPSQPPSHSHPPRTVAYANVTLILSPGLFFHTLLRRKSTAHSAKQREKQTGRQNPVCSP